MEQCKCSTQIRGLTVRKRDGVIIHDVTLDVHHGEIMAIIGRNGAGKTTLLKALLGRIPYTGSITFTNPKGERVEKPRIGYVPQNMVFDRSTPMTVADMLCANLSAFPIWLGHKKEKMARAGAMLQKVGGKNLLQKRLGSLSGGEMQRVLLAFALEPMPDMLLLDEPVSAVDRKGIEVFYDLVTSLRSEYHMPVILVSHDLSHVARYATRAALLDRTILVSGDVKTVMASPQVRETFGLDVVGGARA
ncbi:metal ABC transporter ATP-binding protein [Anaeromassilibacillus sp. D41t1_190614_C2]|uniref:metal ABC transporter ATP-binding protein n=1 Tax=Anaeromassilibacillus sp. D41t1_190614_C2 TaxID=2787078 RepID=UPI00189C88BE|nr:metal ABC transporter ATP-binding protein [Anaeromassilibacillus sp. D41t1_190614_C2]